MSQQFFAKHSFLFEQDSGGILGSLTFFDATMLGTQMWQPNQLTSRQVVEAESG